MKNLKGTFIVTFAIFVSACGTSKKSESNNPAPVNPAPAANGLDIEKVTLSVLPGSYENGVAVVFKVADDSTGTQVEFQKDDGTWTWTMMSGCLADVSFTTNCVAVNESKTIKYRLRNATSESKVKEAVYSITPKKLDLTINGFVFSEIKTQCAVRGLGKSLAGRVKLTNPAATGPNKVAYVYFAIATDMLNTPMLISNDSQSGISVDGDGDGPSMFPRISPGRSIDGTPGTCKVNLTSFTLGGKASGEIECSLAQFAGGSVPELSDTVVISKGQWHCDEWVASL